MFSKVVEFCKHHVENAMPEIEKVWCGRVPASATHLEACACHLTTRRTSVPRSAVPPTTQPITSTDMLELVPAWDAAFVGVDPAVEKVCVCAHARRNDEP